MGAPNASGLTRIALKLKDRFAAKVHNHSAGDLTSGTLGVSRGGTGKDSHTSNAVLTGNGTNAVNDVATASGALYATGVNGSPQFGTLPVAQGGTGATTAANARTNLDAAQSDGATGTLALAETAIGNIEASIADVESTTATANHAIGDYFMLGNVLMRATSAIATGETISSSNATPATVQGQIDTLRDSVSKGSYVTPSTYTVGTGVEIKAFVLYRVGRFISMRLQFSTTQELRNLDTIIGGLPGDVTPAIDCMTTGKGSNGVVPVILSNSGAIVFGAGGSPANNEWISVGAIYIV